MKKNFIICLALFSSSFAFSQKNLWKEMNQRNTANLDLVERSSTPSQYKLFTLDQLQARPFLNGITSTDTVLTFPNEDGTFTNYKVREMNVMHPKLQAKFPTIKSYVGESLDQSQSIRFSYSPNQGLHAMIFKKGGGVSYIDTYTKDSNTYIVYNRKSIENTLNHVCHTEDSVQNGLIDDLVGQIDANKVVNDGKMRKYRLALATTIEYSKYHIDRAGAGTLTEIEQKGIVLEALNVAMTRVNSVYEDELSVTMELIADNDKIIFITSDEYSNDNGSAMLGQNQLVVDREIGKANYDIGHVFSTGGGGVAYLGSPCGTRKAGGVTGLPSPINDAFYIDFVAHEMGHQFGAPHTFNNSCGGNVSRNSSMEPGSGSTIMAYAGICAPNVSRNSDPYFASISLLLMNNFLKGSGSCSVNTPIANTAPVITMEQTSFKIPHSTAFVLDAKATDAENDLITYNWEQEDPEAGAVMPPISGNIGGPMFRSWSATTESERYFPRLAKIVSNEIVFVTNPYKAQTSQLPNNNWEVIPSVPRNLNFTLVVRDNNPLGGQSNRKRVQVDVLEGAPFKFNSQLEKETWYKDQKQTITWDVADTNVAPINTENVKILLSLDGGKTFDHVLAESVPNNGSYTFTTPEGIETANARIMIKAIKNIFLAVNPIDIIITETRLGTNDLAANDSFTLTPNPSNGLVTISTTKFFSKIAVTVTDFAGRKVFTQSFNAQTGKQQMHLQNLPNGVYLVNIEADNNQFTKKLIIKK